MAKNKLRIIIKDLPKDMLISETEKKKIIGGAIILPKKDQRIHINPPPGSPYIDILKPLGPPRPRR
ncbi:MAG: hypothetical protein NTV82_04865 [Candidatus Aminicenantes bacterium]|nr:hypothetical protein [Candidatus Aminicenantes bacterium]